MPDSPHAQALRLPRLLLPALALAMQACGGGGSGSSAPVAQPPSPPSVTEVTVPTATDDGWEPASLVEVGMAEQPLVDALNQIRRGTYNEIHGFVIAKDGKLVLEHYGNGRMYDGSPDDMFTPVMQFDRDTLHIVHSVSKSLMSTLVGIAIRDGFLGSEYDSVLTWFPEHASPAEPQKGGIQLQHLMTMTSGLQWNEWDVPVLDFENNDAMRYQRATDPAAYFFGKDLINDPGTSFYYNTAGFQMMGEVLRRATGMSLDDFAAQKLFMPLGIERFEWAQYAHGPVYLVGDVLLRPRDLARFGQLILQRGSWNGVQIVPAEWIDIATTEFISVAHTGYKGFQGYGFHWWRKTFYVGTSSLSAICADGLAGQAIMIFPSLDMVVVVTGGNYDRPEREHDLVANYVLPAAIG